MLTFCFMKENRFRNNHKFKNNRFYRVKMASWMK